MSTWMAAVVATRGRSDFWDVAQKRRVHRVGPGTASSVPEHVLVDCGSGFQFRAAIELAAALSRDLETSSVGFVGQTTADVYELEAFEAGSRVRRLYYSRDEGGWLEVVGQQQAWEPAFFFDDSVTPDDFPDMLNDDVSDQDLSRYEAAKLARDPSAVLGLLGPSSLMPFHRLCRHFDLDPMHPGATWGKASWWSSFLSAFVGKM